MSKWDVTEDVHTWSGPRHIQMAAHSRWGRLPPRRAGSLQLSICWASVREVSLRQYHVWCSSNGVKYRSYLLCVAGIFQLSFEGTGEGILFSSSFIYMSNRALYLWQYLAGKICTKKFSHRQEEVNLSVPFKELCFFDYIFRTMVWYHSWSSSLFPYPPLSLVLVCMVLNRFIGLWALSALSATR